MDYAAMLERLAAIPAFADKKRQKQDMLKVLECLGNPQKQIRAVHVAGTNGKGSVCACVNAGLMAAGYRVGLFTSPYLEDFCERIRLNGKNAPREQLAEIAQEVFDAAGRIDAQITQFGYITLIAFAFFERENIDYAVIEVGLGGTDDPTNVCMPKVCVITSISLDHTALLGNTCGLIAAQKAGIIKREIPVVTVKQKDEAAEVIRRAAEKCNAPLYIMKPESIKTGWNGTDFCIDGNKAHTALIGDYQADNAAAALKALEILGVKNFTAYRAIENVVWPGRMQPLCSSPKVLLDGAHNPDAAKKLALFIDKIGPKAVLVTGMASDKDVDRFVQTLVPAVQSVIAVDIPSKRTMSAAELAQRYAMYDADAQWEKDTVKALKIAFEKAQNNGGCVVICGSLYLAGEVLTLLHEGKLPFLSNTRTRRCRYYANETITKAPGEAVEVKN